MSSSTHTLYKAGDVIPSPYPRRSKADRAWTSIPSAIVDGWKLRDGVLSYRTVRKSDRWCPGEVMERLITMQTQAVDDAMERVEERRRLAPFVASTSFVGRRCADVTGNSEPPETRLTLGRRAVRPVIQVRLLSKFVKYGRKNYPRSYYFVEIALAKRHLAGFDAAREIGTVGGLRTLYYDSRDGYAVWACRTRTGFTLQQGFMRGLGGTWVHGFTIAEVEENLVRRNTKDQKNRAHSFATFDLARSLGLCAPGILAWCHSHGVDPKGQITHDQLQELDAHNPYVRRVMQVLQKGVTA